MRYRPLGRSGLIVSLVGLGCNNFGRSVTAASAADIVAAALDQGITLFDTADVYGGSPGSSEETLGRTLKGRRDKAIVATKCGIYMETPHNPAWGEREFRQVGAGRSSRRYIRMAVEASLRRLQTDWIDLYQMHRWDPITPVEETLSVLTDLVREGKIRYFGSSCFNGWQVTEAAWTARCKGYDAFVSAQNEYNALQRSVEAELLPACERNGLGLLPFFPLANGVLTGKYKRGFPPPEGTRLAQRYAGLLERTPWEVVEGLENFAKITGRSMLDLAFASLTSRPVVSSVIAGATSIDQVKSNAEAGACDLNPHELTLLNEITFVPREDPFSPGW
jgi:aryl-alcohol dehydrogenase-like predicted oxidoreductase